LDVRCVIDRISLESPGGSGAFRAFSKGRRHATALNESAQVLFHLHPPDFLLVLFL